LCLLVSLAAQAAWPGLLLFLLVLLGVAFAHMRQLRRLVQWIHAPVGSPVPQADGLWGEVFACLERRASMAQDQRQTLSRSLEQFREASQAMPDGVLYLSAEERIVWFNARAALHFGLEPEHDVGQPILNLVRQPEFGQYLRARLHQEPMLLRSIRGTGATLLIQLLPFGEDQKMLLSRDITQIERLETMRRDFVANVSHELRTPLTVVAGFLETVEEALHDAPPDEILGYIALASEQARRMQTLIEDLLTLSALETEAPLAPEEWIDVERMLVQVHRDTELLSAGRHRVHLSVEGATRLKGNARELLSAFSNLAGNAVRYTPAEGDVWIRWVSAPHFAEFIVEDNGIGIAQEDIPRLTERFYRVDRGRSRETGGTGLGLAIVKHILTRHRAELIITSTLGKGSRFVARFPLNGRLTSASSGA
jgi:two-component system, OmpR family, phosphate regulon sensor histidine kinase PhoR